MAAIDAMNCADAWPALVSFEASVCSASCLTEALAVESTD